MATMQHAWYNMQVAYPEDPWLLAMVRDLGTWAGAAGTSASDNGSGVV